jgi:Lipocalin-like domain
MISMHIQGSTFPNWNGTEQKRVFTLAVDQLTLTGPTGSAGGTTQIVWRRANRPCCRTLVKPAPSSSSDNRLLLPQ